MDNFELQFHPTSLNVGIKKTPWHKSLETLKDLAAKGTLSFNGKTLLVDFFSKVNFFYEVSKNDKGELLLTGKLQWKKEVNLSDCDFIAPCNPPWFIIDRQLRVISTEVSWLNLQKLPRKIDKAELQELLEEAKEPLNPAIHLLFEGKFQQDPTPLLILTDKRGAFANLMMNYGNGKLISFSDEADQKNRNLPAETYWEKDLLETGFIKKMVDKSHYYCPLNQVGKSIAFLLELGWDIEDASHRKVHLESARNLQCSTLDNKLSLKGELQFNTFKADLKQVFGAFNRKDRFIDLGDGQSGLLLDHDPLESIIDEIEDLSGSSPKLRKEQIGLLSSSEWDIPPFIKTEETSLPSERFQGTLRPYQLEGFRWLNDLHASELHGILADEMGLGKTVQILAHLSLRQKEERHLIVVPTSLLFNWEKEAERFLPDIAIYRHHGSARCDQLPNSGIILTSYHTLQNDIEHFQGILWDSIILDEAQVVKNPMSLIANSLYTLKSRFRIAMSGTIIENHSKELWAHFHFLMPSLLGDLAHFEQQLSLGSSDSRYISKIKKLIHPFILRRKKEMVAKDFPPLEEMITYVEMPPSQRKAYDGFLSALHKGLLKKVKEEGKSKHRMEIFEAILRLRQIACNPLLVSHLLQDQTDESGKMEALLLDLVTIQEEGKKALIFSQFASMLHLIAQKLKELGINYCLLEGATVDRETPVKQFQTDLNVPFFLCTLKAGGVGLNLTAADYVLIYDPWWHEAAEAQAIGRAHRIGQTKPVIAKRYITVDSIEEKMLTLKRAKSALFNNLLETDSIDTSITEEDLSYLLT